MNFTLLQDQLWQNPKRIVFIGEPTGALLRAVRELAQRGLAKPILVGNPLQIYALAEENKVRLHGVSVKKPLHDTQFDAYSRFYRKEVEPGLSYAAAKEKLQQPLFYAALLIKHGQADMCFSMAADNLPTLLQVEPIFNKEKPFVSASTVIWDEASGETFLFADTLINGRPDAQALARIATDSAETFRKLNGRQPRVALLSFSTKGSAEHPRVQTVREAVRILQNGSFPFTVDGELQFDAAFLPEVLHKKAPQSPLQGRADVFVFPSLSAADPAVRIVQTLSAWETCGPLLQGLTMPVQELPDGVDSEQIIRQVIIALSLLND